MARYDKDRDSDEDFARKSSSGERNKKKDKKSFKGYQSSDSDDYGRKKNKKKA